MKKILTLIIGLSTAFYTSASQNDVAIEIKSPSSICVENVLNAKLSTQSTERMIDECRGQIQPEPAPQNTLGEVSQVVANFNAETLTQASTIAVTVGQTVKMVAAELNVAVNDFVTTPVGKMTAALVILHFGGQHAKDFLKFLWEGVIGVLIIIIFTLMCTKVRKLITSGDPETITTKGWFGVERTVTIRKPLSVGTITKDMSEDASITFYVVFIGSYVVQAFATIVGLAWMV